MNARSLASMAVLASLLLLLAVAWTGVSAASAAASGQLRPAETSLSGSLPGRQAQLMAPECQLERAPMSCERSSGRVVHCGCSPAALTAHTEVLSLVLPGGDTTWPPKQWLGLAAK